MILALLNNRFDWTARLRCWLVLLGCVVALGIQARPLPEAAGPARLRGGLHPPGVWAIAFIGHDVYAGGTFNEIGGVAAHNIARWDGRAWHSLGQGPDNGVNGTVKSLAVVGKTLYVSGYFDQAGGTKVELLAVWQGQHWSSLNWEKSESSSPFSSINTMLVVGPDLYVGGEFTLAGPGGAHNLARWDGLQWHAAGAALPDALSASVSTLAAHGELIYAEGEAAGAAHAVMPQLACWNLKTTSWQLLPAVPPRLVSLTLPDSTASVIVTDLAATDSALYLSYRSYNSTANSRGLLRWNGRRWDLLGTTGIKGRGILALSTAGNDVYVAGSFRQLDGKQAFDVARWTRNSWEALQAEFDIKSPIAGIVYTVAVHRGVVYAGGDIDCYITRWRKTRWVKMPRNSTE